MKQLITVTGYKVHGFPLSFHFRRDLRFAPTVKVKAMKEGFYSSDKYPVHPVF